MKKSLLALAVLGAFTGVASAQSSVTLSGSLDAGVIRKGTKLADGSIGNDWTVGGSQSAYNNFTLSGNEDIGNGVRGFFSLNHRFNINNGSDKGTTNTTPTSAAATATNPASDVTTFPFWRNVWVGLGTNFGDVRIGRMLMPLEDMNGGFDPWNTGTVASIHTAGIAATNRANNAIFLRTANMGGVTISLAGAAAEGQLIAEDGASTQGFNASGLKLNSKRPVGASIRYAAGPVNVGVAYDKNSSDMKTAGVYASYDFGVVKLTGQFEKGDNFASNAAVLATVPENVKALSIGATIPVGPFRLLTGFERITSDQTGRDANKFGLGAEYSLSKRTLIYTDVGKWKNASSGTRISDANVKTQFDLGLRHAF